MSSPVWQEEAIGRHHPRAQFDCGDAELNDFLKRHARRNHEANSAKTFVALSEAGCILGFYSLCPASVEYAAVPAVVTRRLPRHDVPAFRLARLAVDASVQRCGLGGQLLLAAGRRCLRAAEEVGGIMMLIDAKNEGVADWYCSYGAIQLLDRPLTLVLPLATVRAALESQ